MAIASAADNRIKPNGRPVYAWRPRGNDGPWNYTFDAPASADLLECEVYTGEPLNWYEVKKNGEAA